MVYALRSKGNDLINQQQEETAKELKTREKTTSKKVAIYALFAFSTLSLLALNFYEHYAIGFSRGCLRADEMMYHHLNSYEFSALSCNINQTWISLPECATYVREFIQNRTIN